MQLLWRQYVVFYRQFRALSDHPHRQHNVAKQHNRAFACIPCTRRFIEYERLAEHYRGSPVHPNCYHCGVGCADMNALDEHILTLHTTLISPDINAATLNDDDDGHQAAADSAVQALRLGAHAAQESDMIPNRDIKSSPDSDFTEASISSSTTATPFRGDVASVNTSFKRPIIKCCSCDNAPTFVTICAHLHCSSCLRNLVEGKAECPVCGQTLHSDSFIFPGWA
ncbi:hypothetical protein C8J56DRAFT_439773 [Mycena floridula]|nr:hypothetical protein C8J56DRAFT_439773 [Mycena floridula]